MIKSQRRSSTSAHTTATRSFKQKTPKQTPIIRTKKHLTTSPRSLVSPVPLSAKSKPSSNPAPAQLLAPTSLPTITRPRKQHNVLKPHATSFQPTHPQFDMERDPLNFGELSSYDELRKSTGYTWSASRSANRKMTVLLAGYNSFFAQHLYEPLQAFGIDVIPVTNDPCTRHDPIQTLSMKQISEQGMPDVDFVINTSGTNIYNCTSDWPKSVAEDSRINTAQFWSEQIRASRTKPYAFIQMSSALYYPPSQTETYTESWALPAPPLPWQRDNPAFQAQELSLPYWSRLFRNVEHEARVFKPELDARTPEQIAEYNKVYEQYFHDDKKIGVYSKMGDWTPEQQRANSVRKDVLTNRDVRVINFRHGHLLAHDMQEHAAMQPYLDKGYLADIKGHENRIHPWIHVDDAIGLLIHSLFDVKVNGAVNAVAPSPATSSQLLSYITDTRHSWKNSWFKIDPKTVEKKAGKLVGSIFLDQRKINLTNKPDHFIFMYPTIESTREDGGLSMLDHQVLEYGTWKDLPRNRGKNLIQGYGDKDKSRL